MKTKQIIKMSKMDLIKKIIKEEREIRFSQSPQLSLGELIEKIEKLGLTYNEDEEAKKVYFDFGSAVPTTLDSWRGSYSELALGYKLSGYDNEDEHFANVIAEALLNELKSALNKSFVGWKGGDYTMGENTPVWVANQGNSGDTAIVDVIDDGWRLILITQYQTY
jgi:hypothetical protein